MDGNSYLVSYSLRTKCALARASLGCAEGRNYASVVAVNWWNPSRGPL